MGLAGAGRCWAGPGGLRKGEGRGGGSFGEEWIRSEHGGVVGWGGGIPVQGRGEEEGRAWRAEADEGLGLGVQEGGEEGWRVLCGWSELGGWIRSEHCRIALLYVNEQVEDRSSSGGGLLM